MASINDFIASKKVILDTGPSGANISTPCPLFPQLIEISASVLGWDSKSITAFFGRAGDNGKRVQFYESGRVIPLSYECELFDPAAQIAIYWVKTDMIAQALNHVWVAFGNDPNGTNQDNPADVWSNGFVYVNHLQEASGDQLDSVNGLHLVNQANVQQNQTGYIGKCNNYPNNNTAYSDTAHNSVLDCTTAVSMSLWGNISASQISILMQKATGTDTFNYRMLIGIAAPSGYCLRFRWNDSGGGKTISSGDISSSLGVWRHLAITGVVNGANVDGNLYMDGANIKSQSVASGNFATNTDNLRVGSDATTNLPPNGLLDELRISNVARTADWLKLEYYSMLVANGFHGGKYMTWDFTIWNTELLEN